MRNFVYAARSLRRTPSLALAVIVTLALCIGATTAIFSVLYAVLFRPLPFADPGGILLVRETWKGRAGSMSAGNWWDLKRTDQTFAHLVPMDGASVNLAGSETPENITAARVGADFFPLLGVQPALGRGFLPEEDRPGANGVVVLSDGLWRRRFGADPSVIGRDVRIDGLPHRVVGVMPRSLTYAPYEEQLWLPIAFTPERLAEHDEHFLFVLGRLKPGVTLAEAQASLDAVGRTLAEQYPDDNRDRGLVAAPLMEELVRDYRPRLFVLFGAAAFVLLIACANIANLLLARATARARETAIRAAIGAGRGHILGQALAESVLLAVGGGVLGVALTYWSVAGLVAFGPAEVPRLASARVDAPALGFALLVTLAAGLISGIAPALRMAGQFPHEALKEGGRTGSLGGRRDRLRSGLVIAEIALALVLLTGAGLMIRSAVTLNGVDPGFDPRGVTIAHVSLPVTGYETGEQVGQAFARIGEGLTQVPGASAAGLVSVAPFEGGSDNGLVPEGRPLDIGSAIQSDMRLVTPGYFAAMGIRLVQGRIFTAEDRAGAPLAMVINQTLARRAFPGEDPIGKRIACCEGSPTDPRWKTVVGVVGDVRARGLSADLKPEFYLPISQAPAPAWNWIGRTMTLAVRAPGQRAAVAGGIRDAVWQVDRSLPVYDVQGMDDLRLSSIAASRFSTMLLTTFGALALLLAAVGVYGVISYGVSQRTQEIGIRVALGASDRKVLGLVVGHAAALTGAGLALGLTGAIGLSSVIAGLLFRVSP
ncbi:MAG TPA: ABC transporter permease, partial [Gemmatimonadales bacterium]|nr:ABC transporter permease [Gemmatimonadales bacterium]